MPAFAQRPLAEMRGLESRKWPLRMERSTSFEEVTALRSCTRSLWDGARLASATAGRAAARRTPAIINMVRIGPSVDAPRSPRAGWELPPAPLYPAAMVPEARLEQTEEGLAPRGEGWFVLNAREARWRQREGRGDSLPLTGWSDVEAEAYFPQVGIQLVVLGPGEPIGMYHWEADQEDFLVISGEALLLVEGQERSLRQWDFVHCPPETKHVIVGAGDAPCAVLGVGAREHQWGQDWGAYTVDEAAVRHGAGVERETTDRHEAYAGFPR